MAKLKIHGGTRSGESLCHTCVNGHIRKGAAFSHERVLCTAYSAKGEISHPVVECTDYYDKSLPNLQAMAQIATFINSDRKTGKVGFTHADKLEDKDAIWNIPNPFTT